VKSISFTCTVVPGTTASRLPFISIAICFEEGEHEDLPPLSGTEASTFIAKGAAPGGAGDTKSFPW
jgi:hypothetical protein